jgi:hypothetical protein
MNMETLTASLHAGLVQRSRTARAVAISDNGAPAALAAHAARGTVVSLRASDIARARPATAPLGPAVSPARTPAGGGAEPAGRPAGRFADPAAEPHAGRAGIAAAATSPRRFGLTVRVAAELRERLMDARMRTGRTAQSILHDALAGYLDRLERRQSER